MMLGQNEVQEATIVSNGYSGQFGGAAGASINYLTKSGGNDFHGNAAYYWNGSALNANDWIDNAYGNPRPFDIANQWAGSLGGPIKKDKLFFFFDTEGMRVILPSPFQVVLPSAKFESATMANIDSIFGPMSASHKFYQQMFNLYNSTPGASAATPGNFNPRDPGLQRLDRDPRWAGYDRRMCGAFLRRTLIGHPANRSCRAGWIGTLGPVTAYSCSCSMITATCRLRRSDQPALQCLHQSAVVARPTQRDAHHWPHCGEPVSACGDLHQRRLRVSRTHRKPWLLFRQP